jgi:uncharacterized membrane protein
MYLYNFWRSTISTRWFHPLLLLIWFIIGISLRLVNLTAKPPWTDEFSTLVFSLGNSFLTVPLDQAIAPDILLQPLQPQATANVSDVWQNLSHETNHPPLYFFLAHWWMQLFPPAGGLVSLWGARSLPAILGGVSIPAIYALAWLAFRSRLISHLAAAMITISPFGVFLAQEARHYTLGILWVIASFSCFVIAARHIHHRTLLPISLVLSWIVINALGIATHYFFTLSLCTQAIVMIFLAWHQRRSSEKFSLVFSRLWQRLYIVAAASFVAGMVWVPVFLQNNYGSKLTEWIQQPRSGIDWISPIFQALAAWITMLFLLPVEAPQLGIVIASGVGMLIFLIWVLPILIHGFQVQLQQPENRFTTQILAGLVVGAIALFLIFTYFLGIDLTRGARYNFVYFPAVIVLLGASLAVCWQDETITRWGIRGKKAVIMILIMGLCSAVTVVCNLGYQKYYRPDLFVKLIQETSVNPVLIATTQITHVHIGEMMGVAREFKRQNLPSLSPLFLLAHQDEDPNTSTISLNKTLNTLAKPLDLWLVNFHAPIPPEVEKCQRETQQLPAINGYVYELYHCE